MGVQCARRWTGAFVLGFKRVARALLTAVMMLAAPWAHSADDRFDPLGYRDQGNQISVQDTAQQACDLWSSWWGWNKSPYSYQLIQELPARWRCQRYYNGTPEPTQYTYVKGVCQRNPAPILAGSDWSYPRYAESVAPPCYCYSPKKLDRSTEWCTGTPSCTWYPTNIGTECGKTVDALAQVAKSPGDPTSNFHYNQTCIAKASCDLRCKMENCNWLKFVISAFVNPYLQKAGDWSTIESDCTARKSNWFNDRVCAESMARNHIFTDLLPALAQYGCGAAADWDQVFGVISNCSQHTFSSGMEKTLASAPVYLYRQIVRASCTRARSHAGLSVDVNEDIRGKTCMP